MAVEIAPRIVVDPHVRFGKPIIQGTRVTVATVVGQLAGGLAPEEVAEEYALTVEDIRAALSYAAKVLADGEAAGCNRRLASLRPRNPPARVGAGDTVPPSRIAPGVAEIPVRDGGLRGATRP